MSVRKPAPNPQTANEPGTLCPGRLPGSIRGTDGSNAGASLEDVPVVLGRKSGITKVRYVTIKSKDAHYLFSIQRLNSIEII